MPPTIISLSAQRHPQMHCSSWCLPLSAESLRQLDLLQARHINPDSIYKVMYGCSGGAPFTSVYFGARQFLAHTEINTAVCMDTTPSPPLLKDFTCGCYAQKNLQKQTFPKVPFSKYVGRQNLNRYNIWHQQLFAWKAKSIKG